MNISDQFKHQYLNHLKSYLPAEITCNENFSKAVFANLHELAELSSPEVCEARKKGLALKCEAAELAERTLRLKNGTEFIAGVRFKNLNVDFPFIEIATGTDMSAELLSEIMYMIQIEFKNLQPKGIMFKDKPGLHSQFDKWSHTVFGQMSKNENPQIPSGLNFFFTKNLEWHPQYVSEYKERLNEKKELEGFVRIGDLDEFQEAAEQDALLVLNDQTGFAGVFAGIDSPLYGLPAVYMIESYLSKRWVGQRLAPIAHTLFLSKLSHQYSYVWGTIFDKNLSSLHTALSVGRRIIETEYFAKVPAKVPADFSGH